MGRGGKLGIVALTILLVLGGALVVADRLAVSAAEGRIAEQAAKEMTAREVTTAGQPSVSIDGFPFLTQVFGGVYRKITIKVDQPKVDQVQLEDLTVVANQVRADTQAVLNGSGTATADRVTGTATMGWEAVRGVLRIAGLPGVDLSKAQVSGADGQLVMRFPLALAGQRATVLATGDITVVRGAVRMRLTKLSVEGGANQAVQRLIDENRSRMSVSMRIPELPYKLVVRRVDTTGSGLAVVASADNVDLAG